MSKTIKPVVAIFIIGYAIIAILYFNDSITQDQLTASIYAGLLNLFNSFIAFYLFEKSRGKPNKIFLLSVLGGMGARLVVILTAVIIFIKFLNVDRDGFILVFFIFYFLLLSVEIMHFYTNVKAKNIMDTNERNDG
ncbi:MAG: hypothetical protein PHW27_01755 [Melioribacteraceae bacterium]|nr:hypothetical protein [Melioribacteraceae bacterium]MDD3557274.1 hypothetical protein [Melioribacteraceae bacterium]